MKKVVAAAFVAFALALLPNIARAQVQCTWTPLSTSIYETCGNVGIGLTPNSAYKLDVAGAGHFSNTLTLDTPNPGYGSPHLSFTNEGGVADIKIDRIVNGLADFRFVNAAYNNVNMRLSDTGVLTVRSDIGSQTGTLQVAGTGSSYILGSLGIGVTAPAAPLDVNGDIRVTNQVLPTSGVGLEMEYVPTAGSGEVRVYDRSGHVYKTLTLNDSVVLAGGNLALMPAALLSAPLSSPIATAANLPGSVVETRGANPSFSLQSTNSTQEGAMWTSGAGLFIDSAGSATPANNYIAFRTTNTASSYVPREVMRVTSDGNVNIGSAANGITANLTVNGSITGATVFGAVYQDVAEWVPSEEDLAPGTVVVLDPSGTNRVVASKKPYDTGVAGVVSAQPGVILGRPGDSKSKVATLGRVRVRIDATKHPVHVGDLLVTSDTPGTAMVSEPIDIGGVKIHRPGTLIGKALEPLAEGTGEVLTLLSLQ